MNQYILAIETALKDQRRKRAETVPKSAVRDDKILRKQRATNHTSFREKASQRDNLFFVFSIRRVLIRINLVTN